MESLCRSSSVYSPPLFSRRPTHNRKPFFSKPSFHSMPEPYLLRVSNHSRDQNPTNHASILKPVSLTVATAAASISILLSRFPFVSPSLALASVPSPPAAATETLTEPDSSETGSLLAETENKIGQPAESESDQISSLHAETESKIKIEQIDGLTSDKISSLRAEMESKIEQGDFNTAIETLDQLINLESDNSDLGLLKGHLHLYNGDLSSAKTSFEIILEKDPFLVEAYHGLIMVASKSDSSSTELDEMLKRVEKTVELCKNLKDGKENERNFKLLIAQIKVVKGEYGESLKVYGELEEEEPSDFRPYLCKGIVYTILREKDEAENQFDKYKRLVPEGHPYGNFFDDSMGAMKMFEEMERKKKLGSLKN